MTRPSPSFRSPIPPPHCLAPGFLRALEIEDPTIPTGPTCSRALAWPWNFAPKTVFRAGFGIFYRTAAQLNRNDGFSQRTKFVWSSDGGVRPAAGLNLTGPYTLENPFPNGILAPMGAAGRARTGVGEAVQYDARYRPIPRTYQYSAGFERELPGGVVTEVYYSGSQTVHDSMTVEYDAPSYANFEKAAANALYLNRRISNPFYGVLPANTVLGGSPLIQAYDLVRPFPLFNGIAEQTVPQARYRYDSLQVFARRRLSSLADAGIFTFLLSYTFSTSFEQSHRLNNWNLAERPIHEISALDKPQVVALTGLWDLPFGWGRRYFADVGRFGDVAGRDFHLRESGRTRGPNQRALVQQRPGLLQSAHRLRAAHL